MGVTGLARSVPYPSSRLGVGGHAGSRRVQVANARSMARCARRSELGRGGALPGRHRGDPHRRESIRGRARRYLGLRACRHPSLWRERLRAVLRLGAGRGGEGALRSRPLRASAGEASRRGAARSLSPRVGRVAHRPGCGGGGAEGARRGLPGDARSLPLPRGACPGAAAQAPRRRRPLRRGGPGLDAVCRRAARAVSGSRARAGPRRSARGAGAAARSAGDPSQRRGEAQGAARCGAAVPEEDRLPRRAPRDARALGDEPALARGGERLGAPEAAAHPEQVAAATGRVVPRVSRERQGPAARAAGEDAAPRRARVRRRVRGGQRAAEGAAASEGDRRPRTDGRGVQDVGAAPAGHVRPRLLAVGDRERGCGADVRCARARVSGSPLRRRRALLRRGARPAERAAGRGARASRARGHAISGEQRRSRCALRARLATSGGRQVRRGALGARPARAAARARTRAGAARAVLAGANARAEERRRGCGRVRRAGRRGPRGLVRLARAPPDPGRRPHGGDLQCLQRVVALCSAADVAARGGTAGRRPSLPRRGRAPADGAAGGRGGDARRRAARTAGGRGPAPGGSRQANGTPRSSRVRHSQHARPGPDGRAGRSHRGGLAGHVPAAVPEDDRAMGEGRQGRSRPAPGARTGGEPVQSLGAFVHGGDRAHPAHA